MAVELVVGLGNPGRRYVDTRHNIGFRVVDEVARRLGASPWRRGGVAEVARAGELGPLWLAKPSTYMNHSGGAVASLLDRLGLDSSGLLVVLDDVDLALGRLRIRRSGGGGTHNGLRDVVACIGEGFPRLRVGVCGDDTWADLADYVLSPFAESELELIRHAVGEAADAVEAILTADDLEPVMARFNRRAP